MVHKTGEFDSWTILSENEAIKKSDKSFFEHGGSGIPEEIRWFFDAEDMQLGENKNAKLVYQNKKYDARINRESSELGRTRIFWPRTFTKVIKESLKSDYINSKVSFIKKEEGEYEVMLSKTDIDYKWLLKYLEDTQGKPYSKPEDETNPERRRELEDIKQRGRKATQMMFSVGENCKTGNLQVCEGNGSGNAWLDGSGKKLRKYLWTQLQYDGYKEIPVSISIFVEINKNKKARYRVCLEIKNSNARNKEFERFHGHLNKKLNTEEGLVYCLGSNENETPTEIQEPQDAIIQKVDSGEYKKVQVSKIIEQDASYSNNYYEQEIQSGVQAIIPYYEEVVSGINQDGKQSADEQEKGFEKWLYKQKSKKRELFDEKTVKSYLRGIKRGWKIQRYANYNDFYEIQDANEAKNYLNALIENEKFIDEKKKMGNNAIENGIKNYIRFLVEKSNMGKIVGANKLFYGVPGSGKSYYVNNVELKGVKDENIFRTTFYADYSNADFIGQLMPQTVDDDKVTYKHIAGPFTLALTRALGTDEKVYLVIEELNRGNAPAIFGDVFQLLDRYDADEAKAKGAKEGQSEYSITNVFISSYLKEKLGKEDYSKIYIPNNLFIIATMNTSDQNVVPLDTAFIRRWKRELVHPSFDDKNNKIQDYKIPFGGGLTWKEFAQNVNKEIQNDEDINDDMQLGPYFVKKDMLIAENENLGSEEEKKRFEAFTNNVIEYLYVNVCRFDHGKMFKDNAKSIFSIYENLNKKYQKLKEGNNDEEKLREEMCQEISEYLNKEIFPRGKNKSNGDNVEDLKEDPEEVNE